MQVPRPAVFLAASAALSLSLSAAPAPTSEFTSTDPKKYRLTSDGEASGSAVCPGFGGYQVIYQVGDDRSWIDLRYNGAIVALASDSFNQCKGERPWKTNHVVQWRGFRKGNQFTPYAMIFRMSSENPNRSQKPFETLVVVKLDGVNSRVVGSAIGNVEAERIADQAGLSGAGAPPLEIAGAPQLESRSSSDSPAPEAGPLSVMRTDDGGTIVQFPNGQRFSLPPGKGLLGPSENPGEAKPFENEEGWLVALNEQPVTKSSLVHIYLKGKNGRWTELPNVQSRILKLAGAPQNTAFVRVEGIGTGFTPGTSLINLQYFKNGEREPMEIRLAISKTGNLTHGYRGE